MTGQQHRVTRAQARGSTAAMKLPLAATNGLGAAMCQPLTLFERTEMLAIQPLLTDEYRRIRY
ncbi:hypothetical protein D3C81_2060170 [compost metagenome]